MEITYHEPHRLRKSDVLPFSAIWRCHLKNFSVRLFERIGNWGLARLTGTFGTLRLIGICLAWIVGGWAFRQPVRISAVLVQVVELGLKSLFVTLLFAFSFGVVIGMQVELFQKTVNYLPPILQFVGEFFVREQAPVMVGILIAARAGGAVTSELSTMVFDGEVTALRSMGIDPVRFLVAPILVALLIVTPLLMLVMASGQIIFLALYLFFQKGIVPLFVIDLAAEGISGVDIGVTLAKGMLFAVAILGISAHTGLTVRERGWTTGGATTFAVMAGIVVVLILNVVVSLVAPP